MLDAQQRDGRVRRDPGLAFRVLGGEAVLVDPRNREVHILNSTGTRVWELLAQPHALVELVAKLSEDFDADEGVLEQDLLVFVDSLMAKGLVLPEGPT